MLTYIVDLQKNAFGQKSDLLVGKFGTDSFNDRKVIDMEAQLRSLSEAGLLEGEVMFISGAISWPVAATLAHWISHRYQAMACFLPAEGRYTVAIAHGGKYAVGGTFDKEGNYSPPA